MAMSIADEISYKHAQARKYNPTLSAGNFNSALNPMHVPGQPWTPTQMAMMQKSEKRLANMNTHAAIAELKNRAN